ncbi:hypothetical protein SEMRO_569_G168400.1 [Seminavis robusta]|uniref:Uncharacterized protein n=1 Tax=Seminavis robusta TaxID=568900 RepID=A0A9N8HI36_9STRA|nr:hypothetical protein SEMRO_569_G168400.1 [Seminavis robusta]|eukprot:Sro569_g168400.1 n/a (179) ;mRNA; f:51866-52505
MNSLWSSPNDNEEEEEITVPDPNSIPADSGMVDAAGAMEGGDKENDDDDPDDDPKNKNDDDDDAWSESPSNFDFSISSMDMSGIRNNAMQYVAFEAMYSAAYDMVYGACTWPRLLLSYCLGMFGFLRKKNNDADGPLPPEDNNHVQDMAVAASQSAAIGIGAESWQVSRLLQELGHHP